MEKQAGTEPLPGRFRAGLKILVALAVLGLLSLGGAYGWYRWALEPASDSGVEVTFRVPKGATANKVGQLLDDEALVKSLLAWKLYLKLNATPAPKAGLHKVSGASSIPDLLEAVAGPPLVEDVNVTMVEGWRVTDADESLAAKELIASQAYAKAASHRNGIKIPFELDGASLDGYLLPDSYRVPAPDGRLAVNRLIQMQLNAFWERFAKPNAEAIEKSGRSLKTLVILASLLEREEPNPENRPMVAGVIYRRLDNNIPLGIDATSRFTLRRWNDRKAFLAKLKDPSDPYNTRLRKGLPPTPIGAPSLSSLEAALRPKKNPYLYYLHDRDGRIHFARDWREHEANRRNFNVW